MNNYRVVHIKEYDAEGYTSASYYAVERRVRFIPWLWRHVKFYDRSEEAFFHKSRLDRVKGKRKERIIISNE
ncbi:hypothetical protein HAZELMIKA_61 [Klebsiella phage vB_KaeD_HazelMika]|nr:hypothetical protein HAZELMIKA_61 [Klebsiella phage vB_KaeD_HazelMika]